MINVIGLGYIGLPTALMMATHGLEVVGTDYNAELVATLNAGHTTFKEEGLDELFADALKAGVKFTTEYQECDTYIVSVPTPYDEIDKKIDPSYVVAACKTVLGVAPQGATLVVESTISPNTIDRSVRPLLEEANRGDVFLVHAPERIIPGIWCMNSCTTTAPLAPMILRWVRLWRSCMQVSARERFRLPTFAQPR